MSAIAALITSTLAGMCVLNALIPRARRAFADSLDEHLQRLGLAFGIGVGITSAIGFVRIVSVPNWPAGYVVCEVVLAVIAIAAVVIARRLRAVGSVSVPLARGVLPDKWRWLVTVMLLGILSLLSTAWASRIAASPHGSWDAWSVWNVRARFVYGQHWLNQFDAAIAQWSHPDYPMLMALTTSRMWGYAGEAQTLAPGLLAVSFSVATVLVLFGTVSARRGVSAGAVAALALLGTPLFLSYTPQQLADIPIGFFMVSALAVVAGALDEPRENRSPSQLGRWVVAGFLAGCAAWTKREGSLFLMAMALGLMFALWDGRRGWRASCSALGAWVAGALPMCAILFFFRMRYVGADPVHFVANNLVDADRHKAILSTTWAVLKRDCPAVGLIILGLICSILAFGVQTTRVRRPAIIAGLTACVIMLAGFYAVYLTTPHPLAWLVDCTVARLLVQVWPSMILVACLAMRAPPNAHVLPPLPGSAAA